MPPVQEVCGGGRTATTLSVGPVWQQGGKTQSFYLTPDIQNAYVDNSSSHALADAEFFLGMQRIINTHVEGQLGLAVMVTGRAKLNGSIWEDAEPRWDNYTYSYKLQHSHIAVKGKLLAQTGFVVSPWVSGSVGVGSNRATSFTGSATPSAALLGTVSIPNFSSNNKTSFTYTIGAGIQHTLTNNWQVGVGYEFADWGKSELGRALGQTMGSGLILKHLYTNGVLFNITYLA